MNSTNMNDTASTSSQDALARLAAVIESRKPANGGDPDKSYVARLLHKGPDAFLKKIGEEATEVVMAAKDADHGGDAGKILYEVADLWFHSMIALAHYGLTPAQVVAELERREGTSGIEEKALRKDAALEQIHWATNRSNDWSTMRVFAFDHRMQLEALEGASADKIGAFKELCLEACLSVADGRKGYGLLCDSRLGRDALYKAAGQGLWIGRPVEWPGSRPLELEPEIGPDYGGLSEWPLDHVVKCLCFYHPDDSAEMKAAQEATVMRLFSAARRNRLEFLLEVIPSKVATVGDDTNAAIIRRFYDLGVYPDWWKLEPMTSDTAWQQACTAIEENDPHVRGIVVLGLAAEEDSLAASFEVAARYPLVKGFAVGRTIFADVAAGYMAGDIAPEAAIQQMAQTYARLCALWDHARAIAQEKAA